MKNPRLHHRLTFGQKGMLPESRTITPSRKVQDNRVESPVLCWTVKTCPWKEARANEGNFLEQIREAEAADESLQRKGFRKRLTQEQGLWWKNVEGEHLALYVPQNADNTLRQECLEWVHVHPFSGHVGRDRTSEILRRDFW